MSKQTCHRCNGCMIYNYEECFCVNCGHREFPPNETPADNDKLRWLSTLCEKCNIRKAVRGRLRCRECAGRYYAKEELEAIPPLSEKKSS
jgi:hypothetical protein